MSIETFEQAQARGGSTLSASGDVEVVPFSYMGEVVVEWRKFHKLERGNTQVLIHGMGSNKDMNGILKRLGEVGHLIPASVRVVRKNNLNWVLVGGDVIPLPDWYYVDLPSNQVGLWRDDATGEFSYISDLLKHEVLVDDTELLKEIEPHFVELVTYCNTVGPVLFSREQVGEYNIKLYEWVKSKKDNPKYDYLSYNYMCGGIDVEFKQPLGTTKSMFVAFTQPSTWGPLAVEVIKDRDHALYPALACAVYAGRTHLRDTIYHKKLALVGKEAYEVLPS